MFGAVESTRGWREWRISSRLEERFGPALGGLLLLAWLVRVIGIEWGGYYGDERIAFAARALAGQIVPVDHFYPPLNNYLNAVAFGVMFVVGRLLGIYDTISELKAQYFQDPTPFYIVARTVTAFISALTAPVAALTAHLLGVRKRDALWVGFIVAFFPVNVWWAHVSKPQMGMATGCALTYLACVAFLQAPQLRSRAVFVGLAAAFGQAYKHNAIFVIAPMLLGLIILAWRAPRLDKKTLVTQVGIASAVGLVAWSIFCIGILLDFSNFIEYQRIQGIMSDRPSGPMVFLEHQLPLLASLTGGATPFVLAGFIAVPIFDRDPRILLGWVSNVLGLVAVCSIAGDRVVPGLFLPFTLLMLIIACASFARLLGAATRRMRVAGMAGLTAFGLSCLLGSAIVTKQALAMPASKRIPATLARYAIPSSTWMLIAPQLDFVGIRRSEAARRADVARDERLAEKYGIELPPRATERDKVIIDPRLSWNALEVPFPIHGYENVTDETAIVKPYVWPPQRDEWKVDYWLSRGVELVLVQKEWWFTTDAPTYVRDFFVEVRSRCQLLETIPQTRPLFWEEEYRLYRCEP